MNRKRLVWNSALLMVLIFFACTDTDIPMPVFEEDGVTTILEYEGNENEIIDLGSRLIKDERAQQTLHQIFKDYGKPDLETVLIDHQTRDLRSSANGTGSPSNGQLILPLTRDNDESLSAIVLYEPVSDSLAYLKLYSLESMQSLSADELLADDIVKLPLTFLALQDKLDGKGEFRVNEVQFRKIEENGNTRWTTVVDCQDWEIYIGDDPNPVTGTNCEYDIEAIEDTTVEIAGEGEGGGGNGSNVQPIDEIPDPLDLIMGESNLDDDELQQLRDVLNQLLNENCIFVRAFNHLSSNNVKIGFMIDPTRRGSGAYSPATKIITFPFSSSITVGILREEIYHAFQDSFYEGISQYAGTTGFSNIEFEAKFMIDLARALYGYVCCAVFPGDSPAKREFQLWLQDRVIDLRGNMRHFDSFRDEYFSWLERFKQENSAYNYPTDPDLMPTAMLNLFSSPCN